MANNHNFRIKNGLEVGGVEVITENGVMLLPSTSTATTQDGGTNNTRIATTAFVQQEITSLIGGAPGSLNTLNELAAAINDDASYASTLTTALATKLPLTGGTLTGAITATSFYLNDTNTRLHEASGNALRITTGTGYIDIGSKNSGWIHFEGNKPYYFNQALSMDADLKPYNTSGARNLGTTGNVWNHVYAKGYFIDSTEVIDASRNFTTNSRLTFGYNSHYFESGTNSVSFKNSSGTSYLSIDNTGISTGTITATGGNSTNWNTAYTTANAALPKAGGTMTGNLNAGGGINGLTLSNGISGTNFNITGVNQLTINDPGEGIIFGGGSTTMTLAIVDDATDRILRYSGTGAVFDVQGNITLTGTVYTGNGTNGAPSHTFSGDTDTGMYRGSSNSLQFSTGGVMRLNLDSSGHSNFTGQTRTDDYFQVNSSSSLLKVNIGSWSTHAVQDVLRNSYNTTIGDFLTVKASGNGADNHGAIVIADNVFAYGRTEKAAETAASTTAPFTTNAFQVTNAGNANFAGTVTATGGNSTNWNTAYTTANAALPKAGGTMTGELIGQDFRPASGYHYRRSNHHSGHLEGSYNNVGANSAKSNPIYTIGSSYNPTDAALGNMYGIGYSHSDATFYGGTGVSGWGLYVAADGDARVFLGGSNGVISSTGEHYVGSSRVFHDTYHPNADKWTTARTLALTGDVTGSVSWDGSANASMTTTVANDSHTHSIYMPTSFLDSAKITFTVGGDADTYYPVSIQGGGTFAYQMYSISRHYAATAPSTWNTSSHKGGLTLTWQYSGDGFWGGNDHDIRIIKFDEIYSTMVTKMEGSVGGGGTNAGVVVWLRGGTASYTFHGPKGSTGDVNVHLTSVTASNGTVFAPMSYSSSDVTSTINIRYPVRNQTDLYVSNNAVFHDTYHPNADKWTTARTLTLSGDVTGSVSFDGSAAINMTNTVVANDSHTHSIYLPKAGGTMTGDIVMNASIQLGVNRRILGGTTHRALEAHTNGTQLQLGEGYGLINLFKTQNAVNELKLYNNRQDLSNVVVSKVSGYNGVETSNMTFYRGGGGSSGFIRFQNKPTNAASLTDVFQVGDGATVGYGVDILAGGLRINGTTAIDSNRQIFAKGNTQVGEDGTYGNYGVLGFGGITNGYNRVFGRNSTGDGLFLASATGRGVFVRTNGSGSDTFSFTSAGAFQVASTTVIDSSRNISGRDFKPDSGYHYQRSNHHSGHLEGSYNNVGDNSYKSNPIYTIGSSYNPVDASLSNMYGIGYSHSNASFTSFTGQSGWGLYVATGGTARVWLGSDNGVVSSTGEHYVGSSRVFHDAYHPNADKWTTARTLTLSGDVTGSVSFDGSAAINMTNTVVANDSHTHSIYLPKAGGAMTGAITTNSTFDGRDVATDGAKLDQIKTGGTLATYGTTAGSSGRIRCTAPFNTNTSHMFKVTVSIYTSYGQHDYVVGAYMYSSTNQWYSPTVIYTGTGNPDIVVGRDANGKAYISIANGNYTGVRVHSMTLGYYTSLADTQDPWTITINGATENSVTPTISKVWHSTNDGIGSGLNADLLDDQQGAYYLNYNNFTNTPTIPQGDITGVTAGNGLTGGGTSGTPTLHVGAGSGISVAADAVAVDSSVLRTNVTQTVTTGQTMFNSGTNMAVSSGYQSRLEVRGSGAGNDAFMTFHVAGDYATYLGLDGGTNRMSIGGWSMGAVSHAIFHEDYHPNADKWTTARTLTLSGDVTGSVSFDGSAAINMTNTVVANDSHTHSIYVPKAGGTMTGQLTISGTSPQMKFNDTDGDDFWLHVNSNTFYILADRDDSGGWETPYALELNSSSNIGYVFGQRIFNEAYHPNADKWTTARTLTLSGDVTGSVSWDGSANVTLTTAVGNDSHYHSQVYIPDTRGAVRAPSYYPDRYVSYDFQNTNDTGAGDDSWHVLQTVAKWASYDANHTQQQIVYTGPQLKHREATSDSAWGSWKTIWDSSNLVIGNYIPKNAYTMTGSAFKLGFHSGSGGTTFGANHYSMGVDVANGSWSGTNYSDLIIGYHTGIRIGAGYSGIRFYDNSPTTDTNNSGNGDGAEELLMTIGGGGTPTSGAHVTVHNNLTVNDNLYLGDGNDGYFYSDSNGRTAFAGGDFYIQSSVGNCYIYATNTYLGDSSGDNIRFRANTVIADSWGITSAGAATFAGVTSNVTGNVTGSSGSCTGNAATVTQNHSDGGGNYPILWRSSGTTYYTDEVFITASTNTVRAHQFALTAGNSNGIKFWNGSSSYAITMGNNQNNHGTVTDYSIHHNMDTTAGRGFTFGPTRAGVTCSINAITGAILSNNNITAYSDIRIKDNIEVIPNALHKVGQLSGYTFTRTDVEDKEERYTGVIAQEVLKVLPEAVQLGATEEDTMSVAYGNMVGLMIEAIKELKSEVDDLKTQLSQKGK